MKTLWTSRRTFIATLAVIGISALGLSKGMDVSMALASIAIGVAGANAYESKGAGQQPDAPK